MSWLTDIIWPILEKQSPDELAASQDVFNADSARLRDANWSDNEQIALEEARRIAVEEEDRRKIAEGKASNFLLVIGAMIPLLTYLETAIWDAKLGTAPRWLALLILVVGVAYLGGAARWALKAVSIGTYHRVGPIDLLSVWAQVPYEVEQLIKATILAVRRNQQEINKKVSAVNMAQMFMTRAIFAFAFLISIQAVIEIAHEVRIEGLFRKFAEHIWGPTAPQVKPTSDWAVP